MKQWGVLAPHLRLVWNRDTDPATLLAKLLDSDSMIAAAYHTALYDPLAGTPLPADELEAFKKQVGASG